MIPITHAVPLSPPTVAQMPRAALLSALFFTCADLLARSSLVAPRVSRAFARARAGGGKGASSDADDAAAADDDDRKVRRRSRQQQSLVAVVEDAGIKLVGTLHVLLCLPLAVAVLSEKRNRTTSPHFSSRSSSDDPRLLLYSSTPLSRLLVSLSSGYFLWDIASILVRTYVAATPRGRREGRSVGGGFLAHGASFFFFFFQFLCFFFLLSLPYFLTSLTHPSLTQRKTPPLAHTGFVCCCLFGLGALTGRLSHFAAIFLLWEASTPFVYLRWALSAAGEKGKKSRAYTFCGLAMVLTFFVARILFGLRFAAEFWGSCLAEMRSPLDLGPSHSSGGSKNKSIPALVLALCLAANVAMNSLNLFWFSKMVSGAVKHFGGGSGAAKAAAEAATTTTTAATTRAVVSHKGEEDDAGKASSVTATATAATAPNHHHRRVFSVRSTSSGLEASEGNKAAAGASAAAALAPPTPERRRAAA